MPEAGIRRRSLNHRVEILDRRITGGDHRHILGVTAPDDLVLHRSSLLHGRRSVYDAAATTSSATSVGVVPTWIPTASSASFFACAVPDEPLMIAPAWPIVFPGGAEKPAMYENTGVDMLSATQRAAFSSSSPPISPTRTMYSVSGSASNFSRMSMKLEPTIGSPPMPTIVELPRPRWASSLPIW